MAAASTDLPHQPPPHQRRRQRITNSQWHEQRHQQASRNWLARLLFRRG